MDIDYKELIGFTVKEFILAILFLTILSFVAYPVYQSALEKQTIDTTVN